MTAERTASSTATDDEAIASRRNFVTGAVTMAAAAAAVSPAQAQTRDVRHANPPGLSSPTAYAQVVEANGPQRIVCVAGQTGTDAGGKLAEGFRAQAVQAMENIKAALASVGGGFEHVVKLNTYMTDIDANLAAYNEVRATYFANKAALPASTLVQVSRLVQRAAMLEVEVMAMLPPKA